MSSPADVVEFVILLNEDGLDVGTSPKGTVHHTDTPLHPPTAPDSDEVNEPRSVDRAEFWAGVLNGSREISPWCREQVEQLSDPLAAERQHCLALPPALRGRR